MRVAYLLRSLPYAQGWSHISGATLLDVSLKQQALHLASFRLLLLFDLVQRQL